MSKEYTCDVTVCFCINNFNADSEKEYMQKVKTILSLKKYVRYGILMMHQILLVLNPMQDQDL